MPVRLLLPHGEIVRRFQKVPFAIGGDVAVDSLLMRDPRNDGFLRHVAGAGKEADARRARNGRASGRVGKDKAMFVFGMRKGKDDAFLFA